MWYGISQILASGLHSSDEEGYDVTSVESRTREVCERLGLPRPQHDLLALARARNKGFGELVAEVMRHMSLNCRVRLGVADMSQAKGPAYVMDSDVPRYGTDEFRRYTCTMFIDRCIRDKEPLVTQVACIAHELSHVLLQSVDSTLNTEHTADITAICSGYDHLWLAGRLPHHLGGRSRSVADTLFESYIAELGLEELGLCSADFSRVQLGYLTEREVHEVTRLVAQLRNRMT